MKISVTHIITGLDAGGAELMLYKLLCHINRCAFESQVISLCGAGPVGEKLQRAGITVRSLGMNKSLADVRKLLRLVWWLRADRPQIVQTWMWHGDLAGGMAAKIVGNIPIVWNIRHAAPDRSRTKPLSNWTIRACARLSRTIPSQIVCCSEAARRDAIGVGYDPDRMIVIPNGFDIEKFEPDLSARLGLRRDLGLTDNTLLIGVVGRFHPQKDHKTFVQAASLLTSYDSNIRFVFCGDGLSPQNSELSGWIENVGIGNRSHLLGRRDDVPMIMSALDILVSSSLFGEGFPNVIGEAMACGVPCVVTDVGESAAIIADTGRVVKPGDGAAIAQACVDLLDLGSEKRQMLGQAARKRIASHFDIRDIAKRYETVYRALASARPQAAGEKYELSSTKTTPYRQ